MSCLFSLPSLKSILIVSVHGLYDWGMWAVNTIIHLSDYVGGSSRVLFVVDHVADAGQVLLVIQYGNCSGHV